MRYNFAMTDMQNQNTDFVRYRLLAQASIKAAEGVSNDQILRDALEDAIIALDLICGSVRIIDSNGKPIFTHLAGDDDYLDLIRNMEEKMLSVLRDDFAVTNTFLTFEKDGTFNLFSYPLKLSGETVGTISGISRGDRKLTSEEEFIKAVSAVLALVVRRGSASLTTDNNDVIKAKTEAIVETAVTINHEVNNPLTAVLGNIQLLLLNADELAPHVVQKLKAVEASALKIKEVTQNLMRITEPSVVEYTTGLKMVDLEHSILGDKKKTDTDSEDE